MDSIEWLSNRFVMWDLFVDEGTVCADFCLKEDLKSFLEECFKYNIPYTFYPEYQLAIDLPHLGLLIKKIKLEEKEKVNSYPMCYVPLLP